MATVKVTNAVGSGDALRSAALPPAVDRLSDLATRLPWWGMLLSALAAYVLLHPIATLHMPTPTGMLDVAATALGQLFVWTAKIGQYLLPLAKR